VFDRVRDGGQSSWTLNEVPGDRLLELEHVPAQDYARLLPESGKVAQSVKSEQSFPVQVRLPCLQILGRFSVSIN
jgi:hypothetical protein